MVHTLFESILGNKVLEERLQKAAGRRHQKIRQEQQVPPKRPREAPPKRKFDDMDFGFPNGGPTPPVSYERSRPQTPAATPSRELGRPPSTGVPQTSPTAHRSHPDAVGAGQPQSNTRPTTPFNGHFSLPATPPDLFLVTRNSPNLSPSLWENFQPDQLFPDGATMFPDLTTSPNMVDPQLQMPSDLSTLGLPHGNMGLDQSQQMSGRSVSGGQGSPELLFSQPEVPLQSGHQQQQHQNQQHNNVFGVDGQHRWPMYGMDSSLGGAAPDACSQDDSWSNSSRSAPTAPTTLNVEDW